MSLLFSQKYACTKSIINHRKIVCHAQMILTKICFLVCLIYLFTWLHCVKDYHPDRFRDFDFDGELISHQIVAFIMRFDCK